MRAKKFVVAAIAALLAGAPVTTVAQNATDQQVQSNERVCRASNISGMTVKNNANEELGQVEDIVVDVSTGDVQYVAVSYGGFLGLGDKLFAVPMNTFEVRQGDDEGEYYLVMSVDPQTLKSAPGFDQENWPNFADKSWNDRVNQHYSKYRRNRANTSTTYQHDVTANQNRGTIGQKIHRASEITGMTVKNNANKELGEVNDIVVDLQNGKVKYLALSYGGTLGIGDKLFAVPMNAFECRQGDDADEYFLVVNLDEQKLKNAPGFDQDHWPSFADSKWNDQINAYYGGPRTTQRDLRRSGR